MGRYFSSLMQHYGPTEPQGVMPDMPSAQEDEQPVTQAPVPPAADPIASVPPDPPPDSAAVASDAAILQQTPASGHSETSGVEDTHVIPDTGPDIPSEKIVTEVTERIVREHVAADTPLAEPQDAVFNETHLHETHQTDVYQNETHLHETIVTQPPTQDETTPTDPPQPAPPAADPAPIGDNRDAILGALEAHLEQAFANLANPQKPPPLTIVDAADFEPEGTMNLPQLPPEEVREVTREIVREIHHHHHETKVVPEKATAPRTAASASQIGPIRLSSYWGTS